MPAFRSASIAICLPGMPSKANRAATSLMRVIVSAAVAAYALWSTRRGRVPTSRIGVYGSLLAVAAPFLANAAGWIFTEMGRQPFVVVPNPDVPRGPAGVLLHRPGGLPRRHRRRGAGRR